MRQELTGKPNDLLRVVLPAASRGDLAAVTSIVQADTRWVHAVGPHHRTMLWEAARKGRLGVVKFLLEKGADLDVDASRGNHNMPDDPARVIALLDKGADVNITDHKGKTALHRAAQAGFVKIGEVLLRHGAEVNVQDANGETPLFDAIFFGRLPI